MAATRQIKDIWTPLRVKALPLVADADWRASNTGVQDMITAHGDGGLLTVVPDSTSLGKFELAVEFFAANGNLIIPPTNTRITLELIEVARVPVLDAGVVNAKDILLNVSDPIDVRGDQVLPATEIGGFKRLMGVRFTASQNEPIGAAFVQAIARYG